LKGAWKQKTIQGMIGENIMKKCEKARGKTGIHIPAALHNDFGA